MLSLKNYEYQSDFARKYYGQGLAKGKAEGLAAGKAEAVVAVLRARGLRVTKAQAVQVASCPDPAQLDRWLTEAVTAETTAARRGAATDAGAPAHGMNASSRAGHPSRVVPGVWRPSRRASRLATTPSPLRPKPFSAANLGTPVARSTPSWARQSHFWPRARGPGPAAKVPGRRAKVFWPSAWPPPRHPRRSGLPPRAGAYG